MGKFYWKGPSWMLLFGLYDERYRKMDSIIDLWKFSYNVDRIEKFNKKIEEGIYYGTIRSSSSSIPNNSVITDLFLRVYKDDDTVETAHFGKQEVFTFISEKLNRDYVRANILQYSEKLKAPVMFSISDPKNVATLNDCKLISIKGKD